MESKELKVDNGLKPYEEYKKVDLLWLNSVPVHWDMARNKNVMKLQKEVVGKKHNEYILLSLTKIGIIARDLENAKGKFPKEFDTYQVVNKNDLVFCLFDIDETPRTVGISPMQGMITGAYTVFNTKNINEKYLFYYYLSIDNHKQLKPLYTGLRKVINTDTFLRTKMPIPPRAEQDQIVKYLDFQLAKINKFIKTKKKLILALKEQKQAIINDAVTKGINPNVKMKPSGIEWLGDIPEHWIITSLKRLFCSITYGISESSANEGTIPVLTMGNINNGEVSIPNFGGVMKVDSTLLLKKDDLLFNRTNSIDLVGKVGIYRGDSEKKVTFASYLVRLRVKMLYCSEYVNFLLNSSNFISFARSQAYKSINQANLNPTRYGYLMVAYPGELSEQQEIVKYIIRKTEVIDKSITAIQQEIALITEYRTRLISDVVTGKVDVRDTVIDDNISPQESELDVNEIEDIEETTDEDVNVDE